MESVATTESLPGKMIVSVVPGSVISGVVWNSITDNEVHEHCHETITKKKKQSCFALLYLHYTLNLSSQMESCS
jgi:hypothetical protein